MPHFPLLFKYFILNDQYEQSLTLNMLIGDSGFRSVLLGARNDHKALPMHAPETVATVAMKNIPECNASFDPDHLGNICLFPSNRGNWRNCSKKNKNCSTFAVVIVTIGAMVRKPASQNQLMISSYWFANMLNYSCLIL